MTGVVEKFVKLPNDVPNSGQQQRALQKTISGQNVIEPLQIPSVGLVLTGSYKFCPPQGSVVQTAHDGTTTAFWWFANPPASTITAILRRLGGFSFNGAAIAASTPEIRATKFTFATGASGTAGTVLKEKTSGNANQMVPRSATTGMTAVTKVADFGCIQVPTIITAAGPTSAPPAEIIPRNPLAFMRGMDPEFAPGEGFVLWQSVAGTATDPRRFSFTAEWDEVDLS